MGKTDAKWIAGCMSGTSMDGVDVAAILTDGLSVFDFGDTSFRPFSDAERRTIQAALGQWPDGADVAAASAVVEAAHLDALAPFTHVDLVGFHGQTLAHDPGGKGTHQCGDGAKLAAALGRPVAWDFRSNDVALGGQGAPLAPVFHGALAQWAGVDGPLAILNLGGVGNVTFIDPSLPPQDGLVAFDTGPANAPIDDLMTQRLGQRFDKDGALARCGQIDTLIVDRFVADPFFDKTPPKSLDRNDFHAVLDAVADLSDADAAATLVAMVVQSVARAFDHFPQTPTALWVTGGGRRNPVIMDGLADVTPCPVMSIDDAGLDGDMLEAQAFAFLAARVAKGLPTSFPKTTGVPASVGGGIISRP